MNTAGLRNLRVHPSAWPIAVKLAAALVLASLLPMLIVAYYNLRDGIAVTAASESEELEQLASSTGGRIDQLIKDTGHTISYPRWPLQIPPPLAGSNSPRQDMPIVG